MNSKHIERAIEKSAKKAIAEGGLSLSRSGSKELSHLATQLASQSITLETAQALGQQLGQKITELSQARNKAYLDKGTIRTLVLTKAVPSIETLSTDTSVKTVTAKTQASNASSPVPSPVSQKQEPAIAQPVKQVAAGAEPASVVETEKEAPSISSQLEVAEEVPLQSESISVVTGMTEDEDDTLTASASPDEDEGADDTAMECLCPVQADVS
ncbi:MAG: hypothetical protein IGR76_11070 [Synechococcales cyanobacterium T60_A2020_003]|nr:hypothetical protein [Synechococcales cyanobacterium T60_A2020_003]